MTDKRKDDGRREKVDELIVMHEDIKKLVSLLNDIESFLRIVATFGRVLKWIAGILAACFGAYVAYKGVHK